MIFCCHMNRRLAHAVLLGLGLLGWAAPAAARYQDPTLRFSTGLPPGWTARARPPARRPTTPCACARPDAPTATVARCGWTWPGLVLKPAALARHLADIGSDDDAAVLAAARPAPASPSTGPKYRIGMYGADGEWRIERRLEGVPSHAGANLAHPLHRRRKRVSPLPLSAGRYLSEL